jgi:hypothetical protein
VVRSCPSRLIKGRYGDKQKLHLGVTRAGINIAARDDRRLKADRISIPGGVRSHSGPLEGGPSARFGAPCWSIFALGPRAGVRHSCCPLIYTSRAQRALAGPENRNCGPSVLLGPFPAEFVSARLSVDCLMLVSPWDFESSPFGRAFILFMDFFLLLLLIDYLWMWSNNRKTSHLGYILRGPQIHPVRDHFPPERSGENIHGSATSRAGTITRISDFIQTCKRGARFALISGPSRNIFP